MTSESDSKKPVVETWNGSCQCGKIKYKVDMYNSIYDGDTISCNCSICQRNGYLFIYPRTAGVTWLSGQDSLKTYHFASKKMGHRFCPECGTSVCAWSDAPGFLDGLTAINVRTFDNIDLDKLKLKKLDGRKISNENRDPKEIMDEMAKMIG